MRGTEKSGWIYNGAKISDTVAPNVIGKEKMNYPWDVHAAKGIICIDCHFSVNNPGRMLHEDPKENLRYKPRGEDIAVYLKQPNHNFARGNIPPETVNLTLHNTMRGCGDCHDAEKIHTFLPYKTRHFQTLACQTCHIPAVHFWAYRSDDWGFLMDTGGSRITYRGIDGGIVDPESEVTGYLPAYIPTPDKNGNLQIRPTNLITGVYWFDKAKARPVFTWQVQDVYKRQGQQSQSVGGTLEISRAGGLGHKHYLPTYSASYRLPSRDQLPGCEQTGNCSSGKKRAGIASPLRDSCSLRTRQPDQG